MTPEQIDKEKAEKVKEIPTRTDVIEEPSIAPAELAKSKPVDKTPPKESSRQYRKKVGDLKRVYEIAGEMGVDMENRGSMPLMDSDKDKISEAVLKAYPREFASGIKNISDSITAPVNEERNKLDLKKLMDEQKKIRRAKFADSLAAFGAGLQGKTIDSENFTSTKLVRQRDKQFQDYKDVTERNQKAKYLWENQSRKELIDWAEEQSKNASLNAREREKFQMMADQFKVETEQKNRGLDLEADRNEIARERIWADLQKDKDEDLIKVETSKQVHKLTPEKYNKIKRDVLSNIDKYKERYSNWFVEVPEMEETYPGSGVKAPTGETTIQLRPQIKEDELVGAYLEEQDNPSPNPKVGSSGYFDKYRKEKGLPTSDQPLLQKPQAQKSKADPLGLGL